MKIMTFLCVRSISKEKRPLEIKRMIRGNTIHCTKCRSEHVYPNTKENVEEYFGYNRMLTPFRACATCREYVTDYRAQRREKYIEYSRKYNKENKVEMDEVRNRIVSCPYCAKDLKRRCLAEHQRSKACLEKQRERQEAEKNK